MSVVEGQDHIPVRGWKYEQANAPLFALLGGWGVTVLLPANSTEEEF